MSSATGAKRATELSFKFKENGLLINSFLVGFEDVSLYQQGGHHPVHIGDCLGEQEEYRVIHKLGSGGYGIVWLCRVLGRHSTEYVAVKILAASDSGQYNVERRIDGLPDEKVLDILGHPRKAPIIVREGFRAPGAHAPDYAVYQIQIDRATEEKCRLVSERICVIDFGESYEQSRVPTGGYGIPMPYSAPVLVLDGQYRPASDIWALAVAMFYIRTGRELFFSLSSEPDSFLTEVVRYLGPFPSPGGLGKPKGNIRRRAG
ncbi:uncharacterized protein BJX67DRAFT_381067 [Aspergillus lucknowensis]|uniref:Protein kinase domain-containing protein n=1 Tax=Aspergillus lucknowensis TaxID=176173 RepID=A0ABR4LS40_9EURO